VKCMYCDGEMVRGTAPFHLDRKGAPISLDDMPAWVCTQYGEAYSEDREVDAMQGILKAVDEQVGKLARSA
jgi:YgiT-type zinc finger domain-containing protein